MVTKDQGWGCFIPDGLPWQHHAMLLVKSSTMNKNRTSLLMDKEMSDMCKEAELQHTLWGYSPNSLADQEGQALAGSALAPVV